MKKISYQLNTRGKRGTMILMIVLLIILVVILLTKSESALCAENQENKPAISTMEQDIKENKKVEIPYKVTGPALEQPLESVVSPNNTAEAPAALTCENVDIENFFDTSLFIGDSRMQGLMIYSGVTGTGYTEPGLDVKSVISKPFVWSNGVKITIPEALTLTTYDHVFIKLGMNELGWRSTDLFIAEYGKFIDIVKNAQPNAKIYVMAILPVTEKKNSDGSVYNNARIAEFNALIGNMTANKGVNYLNLNLNLSDSNGFLPADATTDGVHLNSAYCKKWIGYIKEAVEND